MEKQTVPKLSLKTKIVWPLGGISVSMLSVLAGNINFFASDYLGISIALVGTLIMISKIFDGFTDLVAGYIVDRTHTRFGKGRPYDLAIIGYWGCTILLFCAPEMNAVASAAYLFIMYTLIYSIFGTLYNCGNPVYMANILDDPRQSVSLVSIGGAVSTIASMAGAVILPVMIATIGTTIEGWRIIALVFGIPMLAVGLIRFFVIKEKANGHAEAEKISLREILPVVAKNKYLLLVALINGLAGIGINLNTTVQMYYCKYIMDDVGLASVLSLSMLSVILVVVLMPFLSKRFGLTNIIKICTLIGATGYIARLVDLNNVPLLIVSSIFSFMGFYSFTSFTGTMVIDCMDYGEWKTGKRSEGSLAAVTSVTAKIGTAAGVGLAGLLLGIAGYNGTLDVQPASAENMIIALSSWIPAVFCIIQFILLSFYRLDKKLPGIRKEIAQRHVLEK